jgi:hypothetical protein
LLGLKFDDGSDLEQGHAGLCGSVAGGQRNDVLEGNAVGVEIEVGLISKAGDMDDGSVMKVCIELKIVVHSIQIINKMENYNDSHGGIGI